MLSPPFVNICINLENNKLNNNDIYIKIERLIVLLLYYCIFIALTLLKSYSVSLIDT